MDSHQKNEKNSIENIYQGLSDWLHGVREHELTSVIELVEKTKQYAHAAEALPEEKVKQFVDNFRYDLNEFYLLNQQQVQHSLYLGVLNESFWQVLAKMTDQSKVEWAELSEDFAHHGKYHCGDIIGFGELKCDNCEQSMMISHLSTVSACLSCGEETFTRLPYKDS